MLLCSEKTFSHFVLILNKKKRQQLSIFKIIKKKLSFIFADIGLFNGNSKLKLMDPLKPKDPFARFVFDLLAK